MNALEMTMEHQFDLEWAGRWSQTVIAVGATELTGEQWVAKLRGLKGEAQDHIYADMFKQVRAGDEGVARVILKVMMPRIVSLMTVRQCSGGFTSRRERMAHIMTAAWVAVRETPAARQSGFQASLSMDIFHHAWKLGDPEIEFYDLEEAELASDESSEDPEKALMRVLAWALDEGVLDRSAVILIAREFLGERTRAEVAEEMGISHKTLSKRIERATASLVVAVQHRYKYLGL
ncbi:MULTISPECIES: hypothetical protein [unclassified Leucobacter]|uniref:hypothetical protein n=1 Tax=unclassified Leucobacter TaxID=2621730 RepID=UPI00301A4D02